MSIWNKILLGFIFVASLVFFHAAIRTIKTYQYWSKLAVDFETKLAERRKDIAFLRNATRQDPAPDKTIGIHQLRLELARMLTNRGRVWSEAAKSKAAAAADGKLEVAVNWGGEMPPGITDKMLVYVFEEGDEASPGKYLGEYAVKAVSEQGVVLVSTTQPSLAQAKDVANSNTPWVLYEMMPSDQHRLFADLSDEPLLVDLKRKWFPEEDKKKWFSEEYVKDYDKDTPPDEAKRNELYSIDEQKWKRPLRDYLEIFRNSELDHTLYADRLEAMNRDKLYMTAAKDDALKQQAFAEKYRAQIVAERDRAFKERKAVDEHYAALLRMLSSNQRAVQQAIEANAARAAQIARLQKEAADLIDRRSRSMAQTGPGAN